LPAQGLHLKHKYSAGDGVYDLNDSVNNHISHLQKQLRREAQVEEHTMKSLVIKKDMMLLHIILQKGTRKSRRILPNTSAKHARVRSGGEIDPSS
jgi:hypothetical protein